MIDLPKRSDSIYKEIEEFEDYEFTNCIAYEMAIRNEEAKKIIQKISKLNSIRHHFIYRKNEDGDYYDLFGRSDKYFILENDLVVKQLETKLLKTFMIDYSKINDRPCGNILLTRESLIYIMQQGLFFLNESKINPINNTLANFTRKDFFEIHQSYNIKTKENISKLKDTRTKKLRYKDKDISIPLNLNLPKDELIAYISKIKDEYDNDNSIVKNINDLLGEDSTKADDEHTQKKSNPIRWADWFYIYDCYKILKANKKDSDENLFGDIDTKLKEHYDSLKINHYSEKQYKIIKKKMIYNIDNLGYKELITGVSNTNKHKWL